MADKQISYRYNGTGNWTTWKRPMNDFQYDMKSFDRIKFRDDPGPCAVIAPFRVDGCTVSCTKADSLHTESHEYGLETDEEIFYLNWDRA